MKLAQHVTTKIGGVGVRSAIIRTGKVKGELKRRTRINWQRFFSVGANISKSIVGEVTKKCLIDSQRIVGSAGRNYTKEIRSGRSTLILGSDSISNALLRDSLQELLSQAVPYRKGIEYRIKIRTARKKHERSVLPLLSLWFAVFFLQSHKCECRSGGESDTTNINTFPSPPIDFYTFMPLVL